MEQYKIKSSEFVRPGAVRTVHLKDGRTFKKVVDKSIIRKNHNSGDRSFVQIFFAVVTLWIGVDFFLFVSGLQHGIATYRPPSVEGFLPISSLMSLRYFLLTGIVRRIHPAGFFILVAAIVISATMKKGFCSWICPVGLVSESLHELGAKLFKRNFTLPRFIDVPLRSLKYVLLAFFLVSISMLSVTELGRFLGSDYNKMADVKLYLFFEHISTFSLLVIGALILLSLFYKNFWCRFACPYGALLGVTGLLSPLKVHRIKETCIDCGKCADVCPSALPVDKLDAVNSAECTGCYSCVEVCPIKDTLKFSVTPHLKGLSQRQYAFILLTIYFGIIGLAVGLGYWRNSIPGSEYLSLFKNIRSISHSF